MMAQLVTAAMTLGELFGSAAGLHADLMARQLVLDSREVQPGDAFIAVPGLQTHGLAYAEEALARGAIVVVYEPSIEWPEVPAASIAVPALRSQLGDLAQRFYARTDWPSDIVGVTGTNGKTTVAWLVAQAENMLGRRCGYVGTLGFGLPAALETHALTTPDCLALHREIASLASDAVALEVSSHALLQDRIAGLRINTAIFTNLTRDHLDLHGSMESYAAVKAGLFRRPGLNSAILNLDDPFVATLLPQLDGGIRPIGISRTGQQAAGLRGQILQHGPEGMQLAVSGDYGEAAMSSAAIGEFNADNLLLALGALIAMEHDLASASAALKVCTVPPGRMEVVGQHDGAHLIVDYAHTPDALTRALDTLSAFAPGRLICVFGCGGERDRGKRALMGRVAAERADRIILTDDNPRREDPVQIVQDIAAGMTGFGQLKIEHDRIAAVRAAIDEAGPGDLVLIAGRGHETVQHTAAGQRPLSDRDIVLTALGGSS